MKASRTFPLLAFALLPIALLGGCGGGSDPESALTKSEYVTQANVICQKGTRKLKRQINSTFGTESPSKAQIASFTTGDIVPGLEARLTALRALNPPEADSDTTAAILDELESTIEKLKQDPATSTDSATFTRLDRLASAYGLTDCVLS